MSVPAREFVDFSSLERFGSELLPATFGETAGATISDPLLRPTQLLFDFLQERSAGAAARAEAPGDVIDPDAMDEIDAVDEQYPGLGIKLDGPTPRKVVDIIAKRKRAEMIRNDIIARGPQHLAAQAARLGVGLAGAAIDPLNIAVGFIPVFREARYAQLAARFGAVGGAGIRGTAQGLIGGAAIEPAVLGLSKQLQLDYDMYDALLNVTFSGALGGGLHVGGAVIKNIRKKAFDRRQAKPVPDEEGDGGLAPDETGAEARVEQLPEQMARPEVVRQAAPETVRAAQNTAIVQTLEGRDVDVDGHFAVDKRLKEIQGKESRIPDVLDGDEELESMLDMIETTRAARSERRGAGGRPTPQGLAAFVAKRGGIRDDAGAVGRILGAANIRVKGVKGRPNLIKTSGSSVDDTALVAFEAGYFSERPTEREFLAALDDDLNGGGFFRAGDDELVQGLRAEAEIQEDLNRLGIDFRLNQAEIREIVREELRQSRKPLLGASKQEMAEAVAQERERVEAMARPSESKTNKDLREAADDAFSETIGDYNLKAAQDLDELAGRRLGLTEETAPEAPEAQTALREAEVRAGTGKSIVEPLEVGGGLRDIGGGFKVAHVRRIPDSFSEYNVFHGESDEVIADFVVSFDMESKRANVTSASVEDIFRRRGIATQVYDLMEAEARTFGLRLVPSDTNTLSDDAFAFWLRRDPKALKERLDDSTGFTKDRSLKRQERLDQVNEVLGKEVVQPEARAKPAPEAPEALDRRLNEAIKRGADDATISQIKEQLADAQVTSKLKSLSVKKMIDELSLEPDAQRALLITQDGKLQLMPAGLLHDGLPERLRVSPSVEITTFGTKSAGITTSGKLTSAQETKLKAFERQVALEGATVHRGEADIRKAPSTSRLGAGLKELQERAKERPAPFEKVVGEAVEPGAPPARPDLSEDMVSSLREADDIIEKADAMEAAIQAAGLCMSRRA